MADDEMELLSEVMQVTVFATFIWPDGAAKGLILNAVLATEGRVLRDVQDEPEVLAAVATLVLSAWEAEWREDAPRMAAEFRCLRNTERVASDRKALGYEWAISAARNLCKEG
jgi:hypothetical protein